VTRKTPTRSPPCDFERPERGRYDSGSALMPPKCALLENAE
jgi:hypothetical protein